MKTRIVPCIPPSIIKILRSALLGSFVMGLPLFVVAQDNHQHSSPARLVQIVRDATQQFVDVKNAGPAGYGRHSAASAVRTTVQWASTTSTALWLVTERLTPSIRKH